MPTISTADLAEFVAQFLHEWTSVAFLRVRRRADQVSVQTPAEAQFRKICATLRVAAEERGIDSSPIWQLTGNLDSATDGHWERALTLVQRLKVIAATNVENRHTTPQTPGATVTPRKGDSVTRPAPRRPRFSRDHQLLQWYEDEGPEHHSPAAVRDRWNREHPEQPVGDGTPGCHVVEKAIQKARKERENSSPT